jgi:hypothetical protein
MPGVGTLGSRRFLRESFFLEGYIAVLYFEIYSCELLNTLSWTLFSIFITKNDKRAETSLMTSYL